MQLFDIIGDMISIILPAYNEEGNLRPLYERLEAVASEVKDHEFEYIFVDDCSTDRTPEILQSLHEGDPRVNVIRFARPHDRIRSKLATI